MNLPSEAMDLPKSSHPWGDPHGWVVDAIDIQAYLKRRQAWINRALDRLLPHTQCEPRILHKAMRYSVLGEGKRIRPVLALAACEAVGGDASRMIEAACALELIHAYSLVHDDLPAMDNDDIRRGKPSCHKRFGEAIGILTGDALLTYAFELLSRPIRKDSSRSSPQFLRVIHEIAQAIGTQGMIGGQVADILPERVGIGSVRGGRRSDRSNGDLRLWTQSLESIHIRKTGALIAASVRIGALLGGATPSAYRALCRYGQKVGLVFQLVDDLLDGDGLCRWMDKIAIRKKAEELTAQAIRDIRPLSERAIPLAALARFILTRST
jgi:geranylgeranyl diphosphate synthase type II